MKKKKGQKTQENETLLMCSFCGKMQDEVHRMLVSQKGPIICSACVQKHMKVIEGEK